MASAPSPTGLVTPDRRRPLAEQPYDRAASAIVAALIVVGACVACLTLVWLGNRWIVRQKAVPVLFEELSGGGEGGALSQGPELAVPSPEELIDQPDLPITELRELLAAVATTELTLLPEESTARSPAGGDGSSGTSAAQGSGNSPGRGDGEGPGGLSRAQRWEIVFNQDASLDEYARQLDFLGIELAVIGLGPQVGYASAFSQPSPRRRSGPREAEHRLYMSWREASRRDADVRLLKRAGIDAGQKVVVQLIPPAMEDRLAALEQQFAGRRPEQIRRTRFGVRAAGRGYELYVIEQTAL